ncbi:SMP-30/gluconolactonase/LRE family protein [Devosia sp.]|uniref:SMP-30/gluconolactonase/LRE family protein n=1 Tax=Devosia sp. TaxID=1871048 RepID=UPI003A9466FC
MSLKAEMFVDSRCELGEGPFWHPQHERLFWFDILNQTMLSATDQGHMVDRITFKDTVAAAAVIDANTMAVAQSGALLRYDFTTDSSETIVEIEADKPGNRSNDSRVHPSGAFWIGTMGRRAEAGAGALYHYRAGKLTQLRDGLGIPNTTCFSPDGRIGYFCHNGSDIMKCDLDPETGMPIGEWTSFVSGLVDGHADGAVIDSEGCMWNARWGAGKIVRFTPDGKLDMEIEVPTGRTSCPAFGGKDMKTLYITTAREGMTPEELERDPIAGSTFAVQLDVAGIPEPAIKL